MGWRTFGLILALTACGTTACDSKTPVGGHAAARRSDAAAREKLAITVYNQNFGLVREIRTLELAEGRVELEYKDVSAFIQPETVALKSLDDPDALDVLEQNYRYDLLTPEKLAEKHVGKRVRIIRWNEKLGQDEEVEAELLASEQGNVYKIGDEITTDLPGRIVYEEVPPTLLPKPTLVWLLDSKRDEQRVEVTYMTQNLGWKADYVLVVDKDDKVGDLQGWVTVTNETEASYENAELKLVAGDVQKLNERQRMEVEELASADPDMSIRYAVEESLFEYHLYTIPRLTTVRDKEQKQVTLLAARDIGVEKKLVFFGDRSYFRGEYGEVISNQKVGVYLDIENSKANGMGMPMPMGVVRVYKADKSGARQFIGEDSIEHTPRDEKLRVKMGDAFDVVGERKQMRWSPLGYCGSESTWKIALKNHKDRAEEVQVVEPIDGDWEVLQSSHPHHKKDSKTFTFDVQVPANGKVEITYRVRTKWC
jgi:hypothetical protein